MNLPPKQVTALLDLKNSLLAAQILPSAADLDAAAEETKIREATRERKPTQLMRHARTSSRSWQAFRRREMSR